MQKAAHQYLQTQVNSNSQGDLLIMLYDACIKFLKQAKEKMAVRDYAGKGMLISRAMDILTELQSSLNSKVGGSLADNLHKLYFYCNSRLLTANMKMDPLIIDEVIKIISGIRDAYNQINNPSQAKPGQAAQPPLAPPLIFPKPAVQAKPAASGAAKPAPTLSPVKPAQVPEAQAKPLSQEAAGPSAETEPVAESEAGGFIPKPAHRAFAAYAAAKRQNPS